MSKSPEEVAIDILLEVQSPHSDVYIHHDVKRKIYSKQSDEHREHAEFHQGEVDDHPKFSQVRHHHQEAAKLHTQLSHHYANMSALHQGLRDESERK